MPPAKPVSRACSPEPSMAATHHRLQPKHMNGPLGRAVRGASAVRGLGPELVPGVEVFEVLAAVGDPAVLELEDDAVVDVQVLAVPVPAAALDADHAARVIRSHLLQFGPERATCLLADPAEVGE